MSQTNQASCRKANEECHPYAVIHYYTSMSRIIRESMKTLMMARENVSALSADATML